MGNRQKGRETEPWELDAISESVGIPRYQLENIYRDFRRVSKKYLLDKYEFRLIYRDIKRQSGSFPHHSHLTVSEMNRRDNAVADRIFKAFDKNKSGRLTFNEFISAYILLQNSLSPQTRLDFLIGYNSPHQGYVTPTMGRHVIQNMSDLYGMNIDHQQAWKHLEDNYGQRNGYIPQEAFTSYFLSNPDYAAAFYRELQVPIPPPSPPL